MESRANGVTLYTAGITPRSFEGSRAESWRTMFRRAVGVQERGPRLFEHTPKVEVADALQRIPPDQNASVTGSCGRRAERRALSTGRRKCPDNPTARPPSGAVPCDTSPSIAITVADHFGPEAQRGCGG